MEFELYGAFHADLCLRSQPCMNINFLDIRGSLASTSAVVFKLLNEDILCNPLNDDGGYLGFTEKGIR